MNPEMSRAEAASRWIAIGGACLCLMALALATRHWPLMGDASLMHYVAFLMGQGQVPYRDIATINMPGALAVGFVVIHALGPGPVAWRWFDFALMGAAIGAMIEAARPYDWAAGLYAGALLCALHARDGIFDAGQRDFAIAVLVLIGYAAFFRATRRGQPWWMLVFGLTAGAASTIKPTLVLLAPALLAYVWFGRDQERRSSMVVLGTAGFLAPLAGTAALLARYHALGALLTDTRSMAMFHAALGRRPAGFLLLHSVAPLLPLMGLGLIPVFAARGRWLRMEGAALGIGMGVGLFSYVAQGKGYPYQRYPLVALVLLGIGIALFLALRGRGVVRGLGYAGLAFGILYLAPRSVWMASHYDWRNADIVPLLEKDLNQLGGPALSGNVQCVDTNGGCYNALYRERLKQSTGFLYDEFLFNQDRGGVVAGMRKGFLAAIEAHPPAVFIVVDFLFPSGPPGFGKLERWPAFAQYLGENYVLYAERQAPGTIRWWSRPHPPAVVPALREERGGGRKIARQPMSAGRRAGLRMVLFAFSRRSYAAFMPARTPRM